MITISLICFLAFLLQSIFLIYSKNYHFDVDQFMYVGSRLLEGELSWTKEFDDKSPILQLIFAIPAFFKSFDVWMLINIVSSLIGAYCLFSISNKILKSIFEKEKNILFNISILSASIYLMLISNVGSMSHINAFCTNLILASKYLLLESCSKNNISYQKKIIYFVLASTLVSISVSIRPYFLLATLSIGLWISLRSFNFDNLKIIKFSFIWIIVTSSLVAIINFLPFVITNNLNSLISTIKINSIEYVNDSFSQTLIRQLIELKKTPILTFFYSFLFSTLLFRHIFVRDFKEKISIRNIELFKIDIDLLFIGVIFPLLIEISILSRHFFPNYMIFFAGYASISFGLFLGLFKKITQIKLSHISNIIIIFLIPVIISGTAFSQKSFFSQKANDLRNNQFKIIKNFIKNERALRKDITFLFPCNNFFHWKLSESRHGFPMAAVYRNISQGKLDESLERFPNLKFNYIMTKSENLCDVLIEKGPDLIFTNKNMDGNFTYDCLEKSNKYALDKNQKALGKIKWLVFRVKK